LCAASPHVLMREKTGNLPTARTVGDVVCDCRRKYGHGCKEPLRGITFLTNTTSHFRFVKFLARLSEVKSSWSVACVARRDVASREFGGCGISRTLSHVATRRLGTDLRRLADEKSGVAGAASWSRTEGVLFSVQRTRQSMSLGGIYNSHNFAA
jgi:hypothetical protein